MLTAGLHHVATMTADIDRLCAFYRDVFEAEVVRDGPEVDGADDVRLAVVRIGPATELNVFAVSGSTEATRSDPMFARGRLDHFGLLAASLEAFETIRDRLIARGAADSFVTDFGPVLSMFFRDPDGLEGEVCVANPDARPGVFHPPGTPAARYVVRLD